MKVEEIAELYKVEQVERELNQLSKEIKMIQLREFEQTLREFAAKHDIDLTESSLFVQTVAAIAAALQENDYKLSRATALFVDLVKDLDRDAMRKLHSSYTLRKVYKEL